MATNLNGPGVCACATRRIEEARELHLRALVIQEESPDVIDLDVASTLHPLGVCADEAGRPQEAEEFYRRVRLIREEKLGVDHPDTAAMLCSLGLLAEESWCTDKSVEFIDERSRFGKARWASITRPWQVPGRNIRWCERKEWLLRYP